MAILMWNYKLQNCALKRGKKIEALIYQGLQGFNIFCNYLRSFRKTSCMQCTHIHTHKHMEYTSSYRCSKLVPCPQTAQSPSQKGSLKCFSCIACAHCNCIVITHRIVKVGKYFKTIESNHEPSTVQSTPKSWPQCHICTFFEHFQDWCFHLFPGKPAPMPIPISENKFFLISNLKLALAVTLESLGFVLFRIDPI